LAKTRYDDGGFSGGNIERPALQGLLGDIRAGRIDIVVVYKVDRLTRSLADFARLVELFDAEAVSFVSVTQQFNTTSSMGRLTLNVLLSFAQFEREVTGERIRDKISASKKKGMWMGGYVPLGYDADERTLVVNAAEAETVRRIFALYRELGCVRRVEIVHILPAHFFRYFGRMGLPSSIDPLHTTKLGSRLDAPPKSSVQSQGVFNDEMGQVVRQRTHESITLTMGSIPAPSRHISGTGNSATRPGIRR
jgi:DNA invertase Pin-like site-specific DNA recombinase